jgi:hypothetical protein
MAPLMRKGYFERRPTYADLHSVDPLMAVAPNALPINLKSAPPRAFFAGLC